VLKLHAKRIIRQLEAAGTTHLLLRCVDVIACELMSWANRRGIPTAAIIAARFDKNHPAARRFCELANDPNVLFVANHNRVATETCIECGLKPDKTIAWDLPPVTTPHDHPIRTRESGQPLQILTAGTVQEAKGIGDLFEACEFARARGVDVRLCVCGDGPLLKRMREHRGIAEGWLQCPGQVSHDQVLERMRTADVVAVPSRAQFAEGLPFVIQEALAMRVPLLLSDHPVFVRYFGNGAGVRFFGAKNPESCASVIANLRNSPEQYAEMSAQTLEVWQTLQCATKFHDLLERLRGYWRLDEMISTVTDGRNVEQDEQSIFATAAT
jgi:glycosyltransferase involved in cell wall biosynthesis